MFVFFYFLAIFFDFMFRQIFEKADVDLKSLNGKLKEKTLQWHCSKNLNAESFRRKNEIKILEILK